MSSGSSKGAFPNSYKLGFVIAVVAFGLSVVGWLNSEVPVVPAPAGDARMVQLPLLDVFYRALAVFGFSDMYKELPGNDWPKVLLEIARFLGPIAVLILAGSALFDLAQKTDIRSKAAKSAGTNAIILGSGPYAAAAAGAEFSGKDGPARVVQLGADSLSQNGRVFRLPWDDPAQKADVVARFVKRAEFVLVSEDDDAQTLSLALAAHKEEPKSQITAVVKDSRLAEDFADLLAGGRPAHPLRIVSAARLAARDLHLSHPPFLRASALGQKRIHAVIVGFGDTGEAIARDLATNCLMLGQERPRLTVIDPDIAKREAALRQRVPELEETVIFDGLAAAFGGGLCPPRILDADADPVTHVYVCLGRDSETLSAAGAVRQWLRLSGQIGVPMFLRLRDGSLLPGETGALAFGDVGAVVGLSHWLDNNADEAAETMHRGYRVGLSVPRRSENEVNTAKPWRELTPDVQRSNHAIVAHVPAKLASAGVDPRHWQGIEGIPKLAHASGMIGRIEEFARLEHDRWNAERRWAGWSFSGATRKDGGKKDELRLRHPDLVPFDQLTEDSRNYDTDSIQMLERLLTGGDPVP